MAKGAASSKLAINISRGAWHAVVWIIWLLLIVFSWRLLYRPSATQVINRELSTSATGKKQVTISVGANGNVVVDGQPVRDTVRRTTESDELRLVLIREATVFTSQLEVAVNLPAPLLSDQDFTLYAIHGANAGQPFYSRDLTQISDSATEIDLGSAVSLAAKMPLGAVKLGPRAFVNSLTSSYNFYWWWILGLLIPTLTYIILRSIYAYRTRNRSVAGQMATPPSNLSPAAAGLLVNGQVGPAQLAATLVNMAKNGLIQLVQTPGGYRLARKQNLHDLTQLESLLVDELRLKLGPVSEEDKIKESVHQKLFSRHITQAYATIYHELESRGFFADTRASNANFRFWGVLLVVIGLVFAGSTPYLIPDGSLLLPVFIGLFFAGWIIFIVAPHLPAMTSVGQSERARWLSFKNYLSEPQATGDAGSASHVFEDYLPYVVSFGLTSTWINKFNLGFIHIPEWYFNEENPGSTEMFISDMEKIVENLSRTLNAMALPSQ